MSIDELLKQVSSEIITQEEPASAELQRGEREYFMIHVERYRRILATIQQINDATKQLKVLDVGCYPYHLPHALELMGHEIHGISSTHEPIKHKNVKVINIETDRFPWKDNFFDLVIFTEVLEHLPQSPLLALKEMYRVTKPGGHLLVTTPNITRSINRGKLLIGKSVMYPIEDLFENDGKGSTIYMRHNREYTMEELEKIVGRSSWIVEKTEYFISYTPFRKRVVPDSPLLWLGKFANYLLMLAFPALRDTLLVIGTK